MGDEWQDGSFFLAVEFAVVILRIPPSEFWRCDRE